MKPQQNNPLAKYSDKQISAFFLMFLAFGIFICLASFILFSLSVFTGIIFSGVGLFFIFMSFGYWQEVKRREQKDNNVSADDTYAPDIQIPSTPTLAITATRSSNATFTKPDDKVESRVGNTSSLLDALPDRLTSRVPNIESCILVYSYVKVPIAKVDRDVFLIMQKTDNWSCSFKMNGSDAELWYNGQYVGTLQQERRAEMVSDWLRRDDPIRCEVTGTKTGKEHVVLAFYRDEEKRLSHREQFVTKLTSFSSESKQDRIQFLNEGEKLTLSEDPDKDNVINVLDYCEEPIGNLPAKFVKLYEECSFGGIFLDHVEYDDEKDKCVPYVKIYK